MCSCREDGVGGAVSVPYRAADDMERSRFFTDLEYAVNATLAL
jgi:hypothetical protein